jgi:mRNA interferase MazF
MKVSRGEVVLVDYPFSDGTGSKVRPALVVQADSLNLRIDDTILAAISRSTHRASSTQLFIDLGTPEGASSGLRQNSMVQCENLLTYDQSLSDSKTGPAFGHNDATGRSLSQSSAGRVNYPRDRNFCIISGKNDGRIADVLVKPGTPVEAGELVVRIE